MKRQKRTGIISMLFLGIALILTGCGGGGGGGGGTAPTTITGGNFWVHVKFLKNDTSYLTIDNTTIIPPFKFVLIDSNGNRTPINAYRCMYEGGDYLNGEPVSYSAWTIDNVSLTKPDVTEKITYRNGEGKSKTIDAWYYVQIPDNFNPVQYIIGYSTIVQFPF
ncbi:MAG: hypothetical protein IEMM0007_0782 [bacterium]|nr:MAG: hypothetical protein IEMM0007_0782 [bacterium]